MGQRRPNPVVSVQDPRYILIHVHSPQMINMLESHAFPTSEDPASANVPRRSALEHIQFRAWPYSLCRSLASSPSSLECYDTVCLVLRQPQLFALKSRVHTIGLECVALALLEWLVRMAAHTQAERAIVRLGRQSLPYSAIPDGQKGSLSYTRSLFTAFEPYYPGANFNCCPYYVAPGHQTITHTPAVELSS